MADVPEQPVIGGLGWKPDLPDARDYDYRARFMGSSVGLIEIPAAVDLRSDMAPIRDQGSLGSCTGFAICAAVEYLRRTDEDLYSTIYSPLWVYYKEREIDGTIHVDEGAYIRDGVKVVHHQGIAPESRWPYDPKKFARKPSASADREATRWMLGSYYRCEGLDAILHALASRKPVVGGFTCYASMFTAEVARTGDVPMPSLTGDYVLGGHAVCFCGYDRARERVYFRNSWGTGWGLDGYGSLPFHMTGNRRYSDDFWCLVSEA